MTYAVLVIDDEKDIRNLLIRILELEGYDVTTAADGKSGLNIITQHDIHVVIADIKLPDIHGIHLTAKIKILLQLQKSFVLLPMGKFRMGCRQ